MKLEEIILRDNRASQPLATAVPAGTLYFVTDEFVTERSNGTTWDDFTDISAASGIDQLTGDVTAGPGSGSEVATIANDAVTYAKIQNVTDARLLGRSAGSGGDVQEITVGAGLSLAAGALTSTAGASEWDTEVIKSSDQDVVNSTTLVDDTALQLAVTANDVWYIQLLILYSATGNTNDFLWDVAVSAGNMSGSGWHDCMSISDGAIIAGLTFAEVTNGTNVSVGVSAAHGIRAFKAEFTLFFSATGTFTFRFAENGNGVGTEARCRAKSRLKAKKLSP